MNGFEKRKQQKMNQILQAATHLFSTNGVQQTSVSNIAKAAHVSQVTIFNYFESKQKLIEQAIQHFMDMEHSKFYDIVHSKELSFAEKTEKLIINKSTLAITIYPDFYEIIMQEYAKPDSWISQSFWERGMELFHLFFEQGKNEGMIDPSLSHETIFFYIDMMTSYLQKEEVYKTILPHTKEIMNLFFYGIAGKQEKQEKRL